MTCPTSPCIATNGATGQTGPRGLQGEKGDAGEMGPRGYTGLTGETGPIGETGPQGNQGQQGIPGENGTNGEDGAQGPPGEVPASIFDFMNANGTLVMNWTELTAAITAGDPLILFGDDITTGANYTFPAEITINQGPYRLIQGAAHALLIYSPGPMVRSHRYQGFTAGQIRGSFGSGYVMPEWWGLTGTDATDGEHEIAINCAVQSGIYANQAVQVTLGQRIYYTAKPVDARGRSCRFLGAGPASTCIMASEIFDPVTWDINYAMAAHKVRSHFAITAATDPGGGLTQIVMTAYGAVECLVGETIRITGASVPAYDGDWVVDNIVNHQVIQIVKAFAGTFTTPALACYPVTLDTEMEEGANAGTALILIGGDDGGGNQSYFSSIEGIAVHGYNACIAHPEKRISLVSWTGWVEENSFLHNVTLTYFTGFAVGGTPASGTGVINGLTLSKFWIYGGMRRYAVPVYINQHASVCNIRDGTIDMTIGIAESLAGAGDVSAPGGPYFRAHPQYGILCAGAQTVIEGVHLESCHNSIHVFANESGGHVTIRSCTETSGIDFGMRYTFDTARQNDTFPDPVTEKSLDNLSNGCGYYYHHSCFVSLGERPGLNNTGDYNYNMLVTVDGLSPTGHVRYLLRDAAYGKHENNYGGRLPNYEGRVMGLYSRGIPAAQSLDMPYTATATADAGGGPGSGTLITVGDTSDIDLAFLYVYLRPDNPADVTYQSTTAFVITSVASPTTVIINKPYMASSGTGHAWFNSGDYTTHPLSKTFFIGPIW